MEGGVGRGGESARRSGSVCLARLASVPASVPASTRFVPSAAGVPAAVGLGTAAVLLGAREHWRRYRPSIAEINEIHQKEKPC